MATYTGTSGGDDYTGTSGDDTFRMFQGGDDFVQGLGGNDVFQFGAALNATDHIEGGGDSDTLQITGDYSAGLTFDAATISGVEQMQLGAGFSYTLTTNDGNVAAGEKLTVTAASLGSGNALTFDGSAETNGTFKIIGGAGADVLTGGAGNDVFDLSKGGEDTAHGGGGNDIFVMGARFDAGDRLDGGFDSGAASNVLRLDGDYSGGVTLGANTIANIHTLQFEAGHDYKIVADAQSFLSGPTVNIEGGQLGAGDDLVVDGSASDANFHVKGGAGNDVLSGGSAFDIFDLTQGGNDTVSGGESRDIFRFGGTLTASDHIDGGAGNDSVDLDGMGSNDAITFGANTLTSVETLYLAAGHSYTLTMNDGNVASGATLLVDGSTLDASSPLIFNGAAETDGSFTIRGGAGDDTLTGGAQADTFNLTKGGNDTAHGGGGSDTFNMGGTFDTSDQIDGGTGTNDTLSLNGTYATPITVSGTMVQNVDTVTLAGDGYNIAWQSAIGSGLTVDASAIGRGVSVIFDSSALATGDVHLIAGAGSTSFIGGGGDDVVDLQNSADGYRVSAGDGDDTVNFGAQYGTGLPFLDLADGNGGSNTATFDGDYSGGLTLGVQSFIVLSYGLTDFQTVKLLGDHSYTVTFDDSQVPSATLTGGAALTVDASALGAGDQAVLDFSLSAAPGFTVTGSAGDDTVTFAANFAAGDAIDGGAGNDTLALNGDYSAGLVLGATTITNVETLKLDDGFSYKLTTNDATVASGQTLTVDASALTGTNALTFDGSAETNGFFAVTGGAGDDSVTFGSHYSVSDTIDGGAGNDTVTLTNINGHYNFTATTIANVEDLVVTFQDNSSVNSIKTTDANVAAGATMIVDFSGSGAVIGLTDLTFDGSAEQDGHFNIIAPHRTDHVMITGGALSDSFTIAQLDGPNNTFTGLGGDDTVTMASDAFGFLLFDGGSGSDTVALTGGGTISGNDMVLTSVENMTFDNHSWNVTLDNGTFTGTLNVDATALTAGHTLAFDGSQNTGGAYVFTFAGNFVTGDSIKGGAGSDTLSLNGDYSAPLIMGASTISSINKIVVADGYSYDLVSDDANVASGVTLAVDGSALTGGNTLSFSGSAELDGHFAFISGAGTDVLEGGAQSDSFDLSRTTTANAFGGGGNDAFEVTSAAMIANGLIDGGAGSDTLRLDGDFSTQTAITASTVTNIETLQLEGPANSYNLTLGGGIAGAATLTIDGRPVASLTLDASGAPATAYAITGSAGNDTLTGGGQADTFDLKFGGNDTVHGGAGNDTFSFSGAFTAADTVDGGANSDTISLNGDYSGGLTFSATNMTSVETLVLNSGHNYNLTTNDANVAAAATLNVVASSLGAGDTLIFDGSAETDGSFAFTGGAGNDTLTGGAQADTFDLTTGGTDTVHGGGGSDTITAGSNFSVSDSIDGGAGNDTLTLNNVKGTYDFTNTTMTNVETLAVNTAFLQNIAITTTDANVAAGATLTVDFSPTSIALNITFDGSAEQDGHFAFIPPGISNGVVTLTGGALSDSFALLGGDGAISNLFNGGGGDDTLNTIALASAVNFDGGTGNDTVALTGGGTESNTRLVLTSVENMTLDDNGWNVTMGNIASGDTLNVNATALSGSHTLTFDGSEITNGARFVFSFAGNFVTGDSLTGGAGSDTLALNGDYTLVGIFGASTISSVETITVADGHSYDLDTNDANVAAGATLTVDASALTGANQLFFSGGNETDGHFAFIGGASDDDLTGGAQSDTFDLSRSDGAFVFGNGGNDSFTLTSAAKLLGDSIDGGAGSDTLILNGDFSTLTTITGSNLTSVEALTLLGAANSYDIVFTDGITTALTVDASAAASLIFDATGDTATSFTIVGSAGNDTLTGGGLNDGFNLTLGGNDTAHGGAGNDTFSFSGTFTAADTVDGGANSDTISLNGDYSTALTLGAATLTSVENIVMQAGHNYDLITNDANVAAAATLNVTASSLGAGDTLTFDGSAETDGHFAFTGGAGNDALTGGAQSDTFDLTKGGTDTVHGGGGSDTITIGNTFTAADSIDGGTGSDTVNLVNVSGTYTFTATTIQNVEDLAITGTEGSDASFTTNDANVAAGATMIVDFSSSGPVFGVNSLTFDGSAETDGHFAFVEPAGSFTTTLTGGALSDTLSLTHGDSGSNFFNGLGGDDTVTTTGDASALAFDGGAGNDTLAFTGGGDEDVNYNFTSVENVTFDDNNWTVEQRFEGTPVSLNIDATALSGGHTLTFNGIDTFDIATDSFVFEFAGNFIAGDSLTGGASDDTLSLNGDDSVIFDAATIASVETITVANGHSYFLTLADGNVASGATLTVDSSALTGAHQLIFDGSSETNGHFAFIGGAADELGGGSQSDTFDLSRSDGSDVSGNGGNDSFTITTRASLLADTIDGGAGTDKLILNGDFSTATTLSASNLTSIEALQLAAGHSYALVETDAIVASAQTLTVDASALGAANALSFDGSAETDGFFAITGGTGNDSVTLASRTVFATSTFDGGAGSDTLTLNGNFGTSTALTATTLINVEKIVFDAATTNYSFVANDATIASGKTLTLDGTALTHALNWDATAETDGFLAFTGGAGNDTLTLGSATVLAGSTLDGGTGSQNNFLALNGDFSAGFTFTAAEMTNFQNLTLGRNHSYHLTTVDANVAAGSHLSLNGLALVSTDTIYFNGSAETDGLFTLEGGQGADTLIGGAGNDTFFGYIGADTMTGGAGVDSFNYTFAVGSGVSESTSTGYDTITDINFSVDRIDPPGANGTVTGVDTAIVGGALSTASFDADLAAAVNAGTLAVAHAVLFTANSGTLSGHTFLVVDENGTAGYQASADLVIDVTGYTGTLTTGSFV